MRNQATRDHHRHAPILHLPMTPLNNLQKSTPGGGDLAAGSDGIDVRKAVCRTPYQNLGIHGSLRNIYQAFVGGSWWARIPRGGRDVQISWGTKAGAVVS